MQDKFLCPIPWMSQSLRANGDIRICCQAQHGPQQGLCKDNNGKVLNAKNSNLNDARNSQLSKDVRSSMINGEWHPECRRCQTEEDAGMFSRRHVENKIWMVNGYEQIKLEDRFTWEELLSHTCEDGTIDVDAIDNKFFDLRFGNLCNLKCRMCGPTDSSMWYNDQAKLWGDSYSDSHGIVKLIKNSKGKYFPEEDVYNWHENKEYWEQMERFIPQIKKLYVVGGEPLMIDQHYNFLQKCVDRGYAKDIIVEYNSNITNIPERAWNIWKNFRRIGIGASIDAVGDLNRYIRYPSDFDTIWKNLNRLSKAEGKFRIWYATTINVYNILHLPEMLEFIIRNQLKNVNDDNIKPLMSPHPLHGPQFLNIRMLPKEVKKEVEKRLKKEIPRLTEVIENCIEEVDRKEASKKHLVTIFETYIKYMNDKDFSDKIKKFWEHTNKLDEIRGHYFKDYCHEMFELLKDYK